MIVKDVILVAQGEMALEEFLKQVKSASHSFFKSASHSFFNIALALCCFNCCIIILLMLYVLY